MKRIILMFCILSSLIVSAMDAPNRRSSSGRNNTLLARHKRHSSLGDKALTSITKTTDCASNIDALVIAKKAASEQTLIAAGSSDEVSKSNSRNFSEKAAENNRNHYIKMTAQAYSAIRNIKAINDDAYKQYVSHVKYAKHYYTSWMSLVVTKDTNSLEKMVEQEFKAVEDAFHEKMALVLVQKK